MDGELLADQPLGHKLIKKGFWLYFFMIISAPVAYIVKVIISNTLSVEEVGIFYSVYGLILLVATFHDLGLTEALQYFLPKYRLEKKINNCKTIIILTLLAQLIFGTGIAIAMYFGANRLAINHFHTPAATQVIKTLCFYFIGINIVQVFNSIYYAFQDVTRYGWIEFSRVYTLLGFTIFFWLGHRLTIGYFSIAWIVGVGMAIIVGALLFGKKYRNILNKGKIVFDSSIIKTQLKYAFRVFMSTNALVLIGQVDQQLVVNLLGPTSAGYFTNYLSILTAYGIITTPILSLIFPIVSEIMAKKNYAKLKLLQNTLYKYLSVFALSIGGLFIVLGPEIMTIFFGQKFLISGELLKYAGPFLIVNVIILINFGILAGTGKVKQRTIILGLGILAMTIAILTFIKVYNRGLIGAVIGTMIGWIVLGVLSFRIVHKFQKISFNWGFFLKNIVIIISICILIGVGKKHLFILQDMYRYNNLVYLASIVIIYYLIIAGANYPSFKLLKNEIINIRGKNK